MAKKSENVSQEALAERIAALEKQLQKLLASKEDDQTYATPDTYCRVPELPPRAFGSEVSAERARLILYSGRKWVNGTNLHYYFFDDALWGADDRQKDVVRAGFKVWKELGIGLTFKEVFTPDAAEIRIGFLDGDGYWSYTGTDVLTIGQHERTMNFGSDLTRDSRGVDVPVHEIGHTLGFPHEHQNPLSGIVWDEEAVYDYFAGPPNNWDQGTTFHNILRKIPQNQVEGSEWDPDSIMHYAFRAGLIKHPVRYQTSPLSPAPGLSDKDIEQVKFFYPPIGSSFLELKPFESQRLSLAPGEQANFTIRPAATRTYTIQTFGFTDSVAVLFEDVGGTHQYIAGDDDSGWNRNARLQVRLYTGRTYTLRIRLFYQWASGETAVMLS